MGSGRGTGSGRGIGGDGERQAASRWEQEAMSALEKRKRREQKTHGDQRRHTERMNTPNNRPGGWATKSAGDGSS